MTHPFVVTCVWASCNNIPAPFGIFIHSTVLQKYLVNTIGIFLIHSFQWKKSFPNSFINLIISPKWSFTVFPSLSASANNATLNTLGHIFLLMLMPSVPWAGLPGVRAQWKGSRIFILTKSYSLLFKETLHFLATGYRHPFPEFPPAAGSHFVFLTFRRT